MVLEIKYDEKKRPMISLIGNEKDLKDAIQSSIVGFQKYDQYRIADEVLSFIIEKYPTNSDEYKVEFKLNLINNLYSTYILDIRKLSKSYTTHLAGEVPNTANRAALITKLAKEHPLTYENTKKEDVSYNFYSIATKYAHWHWKNTFVIYDSIILDVLMWINNMDLKSYTYPCEYTKTEFTKVSNYEALCKIITNMNEEIFDSSLSIRELDHGLWLFGKYIKSKREEWANNKQKDNIPIEVQNILRKNIKLPDGW